MKIIIYLLFVGLICRITAEPVCSFDFDNEKYFCPLTGGNIEADYEGSIGGTHWKTPVVKNDTHVQMLISDEVVKEFILNKIFNQFRNLEVLEFRKGSVAKITKDYFFNCNKLEKVLIKESVFTDVPDNIFGNCTALKEIDFGNNDIKSLGTKAFIGLVDLEILRLNDNNLEGLRPSDLSPLQKLQTLDLSRNNIKLLGANVFSSNVDMKVLMLAENKLEILILEHFNALKGLTSLDLTRNVINSTTQAMVENLVGLSSVKFKENACIDKDFENFIESDVDDFKTCIENSGAEPIIILSNLALVLSFLLKFL